MNDTYKKILEQFNADGEDNLWLITMTDLMSLLLVCFLMFFVITKRQEHTAEKARDVKVHTETEAALTETGPLAAAEHKAAEAPPKDQAIQTASLEQKAATEVIVSPPDKTDDTAAAVPVSELQALIEARKLGDDVTVTGADHGLIITLREKVLFVPGSAVILKSSIPVMDKVAELIKRHPSYVIEIDGHTDNSPIHSALYPSNWELSSARAISVLKYFINVKGVDPSGFTVKGNGHSRPVVPNDSPQHMAQNRRVEIRIKEKNI